MKKKVLIVLFMCMMFVLSACSTGGKKDKGKGEDNIKAGEEQVSVDGQDVGAEYDEDFVVAEGNPSPDIEFTLMDGTTKKISDYKGKPILINFWATWCGYCVDEMPAFEMLKEKYGDEIEIVALNCGGDTEEDIKAYAEDNGYTFDFAIVSDEEANKYEVQSIPATAIIDQEGNISYMLAGAYDAETMFNEYYSPEIDKVLNK